MSDIATHIILLLALAAFAAGFIDSIAGGGGLIAIPALLLAGFPPAETLGTNKLQGLFGSGSAALHYAAKGQVDVQAAAAVDGACLHSLGDRRADRDAASRAMR